MIRPIDPRVCAIIDQAQRERFTITRCNRPTCYGPVIHSKIQPLARCMNCGDQRQLQAVTNRTRKWKCDACRRFYWAVLGRAKCPACTDRDKRRTRRGLDVQKAA